MGEASFRLETGGQERVLHLLGDWTLESRLPEREAVLEALRKPGPGTVRLEVGEVTQWDSGLLTWLMHLKKAGEGAGLRVQCEDLPPSVASLLKLATAARSGAAPAESRKGKGVITEIGEYTIQAFSGAVAILTFIGETALASLRLLLGRGRWRWGEFWVLLEDCGARALPIVGLISFLVGLIMAFVGAIQLAPFGADLYVANLVGVAMVREMGAMMAGIILAGRTGASFAAQLGTMRVNEEIDALKTFGFSPTELLVVPRMLALSLMMPLLCVFADFIGMVGGAVVTVSMLDVTLVQYYNQTTYAVSFTGFMTGIIKASVFGVLVAAAGCLRGMQCGGSSAAVGEAATSAVVTGITAIIIADAIFAVLFNVLGI